MVYWCGHICPRCGIWAHVWPQGKPCHILRRAACAEHRTQPLNGADVSVGAVGGADVGGAMRTASAFAGCVIGPSIST